MAKYVYNRYELNTFHEEEFQEHLGRIGSLSLLVGYPSYEFDQSGIFTASGSYTRQASSAFRVANSVVDLQNGSESLSGKMLMKLYRATLDTEADVYRVKTTYSRGILIDEIVAEEGLYPINGRSGNYWYVRGERYAPFPQVKVDGAWKEPVEGFMMIDGEPRPIVESLIKENGEWKTLV